MTTTTGTYVVSDLHLGVDRNDPRGTGPAFADFLHQVVIQDPHFARRLVLLGDTFELAGFHARSGERETWAVRRLDLLGGRHAPVFAALRDCIRKGIALDVVAGNHDIDLARPRVRERMSALLGDDVGAVRVHPWALHVSGAFHATHGHQHHDLNRSPTLLAATLPGPAGELPAPPLAALAEARRSGRGHLATAVAVLRATHGLRQAEKLASGPAYAELLVREAAALGMTLQTVQDLRHVSEFRTLQTAGRLARAVATRRFGHAESDEYLRQAAVDLAAALAREHPRAPFIVFGHTHRARLEPIRGRAAWYVNSGTWSSAVRGSGRNTTDLTRFPYVRITESDSDVTASVEHWAAGASVATGSAVTFTRPRAPPRELAGKHDAATSGGYFRARLGCTRIGSPAIFGYSGG